MTSSKKGSGGRRGPLPKPTSLRVIEGNPSRRPLPRGEIQGNPAMPSPPDHLQGEALAEWNRVAPGIHAMGILTCDDMPVLAAYCHAYETWAEARRAINKMRETGKLGAGLMIKTTNGNYVQNPLIGIANNAGRDMVNFAGHFGLSPAIRARLAIELDQVKDPMEALLFGKTKKK